MSDTPESKWLSILDKRLPMNKRLWAYDMFYDCVHLAYWGGNTSYGAPRLISEQENGDDYWFIMWQPCNVPIAPEDAERMRVHDEIDLVRDEWLQKDKSRYGDRV